jgi:hypothetical protein
VGIGDWGLGIGDCGLGPIPNPQSPIPNPQSPIPNPHIYLFIIYLKKDFKKLIIKKEILFKIMIKNILLMIIYDFTYFWCFGFIIL